MIPPDIFRARTNSITPEYVASQIRLKCIWNNFANTTNVFACHLRNISFCIYINCFISAFISNYIYFFLFLNFSFRVLNNNNSNNNEKKKSVFKMKWCFVRNLFEYNFFSWYFQFCIQTFRIKMFSVSFVYKSLKAGKNLHNFAFN